MTAAPSTMIFRGTNAHTGRHISVTPGNSANRHLCYGRIILRDDVKSVSFSNGGMETGLIVLSGRASLAVNEKKIELGQYDGIYIPRDAAIRITSDGHADIAEFSAAVDGHYPLQIVRYADGAKGSALKFTSGG